MNESNDGRGIVSEPRGNFVDVVVRIDGEIVYGPGYATNKPVSRSKKQAGRSPARRVIAVARGAEARERRARELELAARLGVSRSEAEAMAREARS